MYIMMQTRKCKNMFIPCIYIPDHKHVYTCIYMVSKGTTKCLIFCLILPKICLIAISFFYIIGAPSEVSEALLSPASQLGKQLGKLRQTIRQS